MLLELNEQGDIVLKPGVAEMSDKDILLLIDDKFPYRTKDGKPSYRGDQQTIILRMIKACIAGKKFVMLDAPVGSGKSIILYTTMLILGPAVYLTSQVQLQEQISNEKWPEVRVVKGGGHYACNYVSLKEDLIRCNYHGDEQVMCNNTDKTYSMRERDNSTVLESIKRTLEYHKHSMVNKKLHSAFSDFEDAKRVADMVTKTHQDTVNVQPVAKYIGCSLEPCECPKKAARQAAKYSGVRVLTPDIYYLLDLRTTIFSNSVVMAIDECHSMENVLQRMLGASIPIETIKEVFGVDLYPLTKCKSTQEFIDLFNSLTTKVFMPIVACMRVIHKTGDLMKIESPSDFNFVQNKGELTKEFFKGIPRWKEMDLSAFDVMNAVFANKDLETYEPCFIDFMRLIRQQFQDELTDLVLNVNTTYDLSDLMKSCLTYVNKVLPKDVLQHPIYEAIKVASYFSGICNDWINTICLISNIKSKDQDGKEFPVFTTSITEEYSVKACSECKQLRKISNQLYLRNPQHRETVLGIVPINVASIMHALFYHKVRTVFLSTGTWVDIEGKKKMYGINNSCEYVHVKSTFHPLRRQVYVLHDRRYTNFSERDESQNNRYVYQTDKGVEKFINEFEHTLKEIKKFIKLHDNLDTPNILVHCHKFDIAKCIATRAHVDESYLIHLGKQLGNSIDNVHGKVVEIYKKEEILHRIITNPDSGLVVISPSISEGVDFKYGIARAQIIIKRPVPYMGDTYVKTIYNGSEELGLKGDRSFIEREIYTTITQQYGRIVRASDDWGYTFILDQSFALQLVDILKYSNLNKLYNMNINYFIEGLQKNQKTRALIWPLDKLYI